MPAKIVLVILAVALAGCAGKHRGAAAQPGALLEILVQPQAIDPAADKYLDPEYAYVDTRVAPAGKLVVYLVGANGKPERGKDMMKELAAMGFVVIAPAYANDYDIRAKCEKRASDPDEDCHGKARLEAFEGKDTSPHIDVSRANSIEGRVARMLGHLAKTAPAGDWGRYLDGAEPRWPAIVIAGHSHGASSAGLIAKVRNVDRAVILSGPFDNREGDPAAWMRWPSVTPRERVYAFSHALEEQHRGHLANWEALGLGGAVTIVDGAAPPFAGSHRLVTAWPPEGNANPHGMTAAGKASPRLADGQYRLAGIFRYLFGR
jgi:hypothetical protein